MGRQLFHRHFAILFVVVEFVYIFTVFVDFFAIHFVVVDNLVQIV